MKRLGFIGAGNMGGAILSGLLRKGCLTADQVMVSDKAEGQLSRYAQLYPGLTTTTDNRQVAKESQMILLAVKPQFLRDVLTEIRDELKGKAVISIAAGWTQAMLNQALEGTGATVLRAMPNTPALVGEGMTALCAEYTLSAEDYAFIEKVFQAVGRVVVLPERMFDGVIAVCGSSPAYLYMMLEAMGDGAVREGIPRKTAYELAAQAMLGCAKMVLETGAQPRRARRTRYARRLVLPLKALLPWSVRDSAARYWRQWLPAQTNPERCPSKGGKPSMENASPRKQVQIYTDGACSGNPGPGGWGAILVFGPHRKEMSGYMAGTTNNRMELFAAISALGALKEPCDVKLYSDSSYLVKAFQDHWIDGWQKRGWKNAAGDPVENQDLWWLLITLTKKHQVEFLKVKGHSDHPENNRCDELARAAIEEFRRINTPHKIEE